MSNPSKRKIYEFLSMAGEKTVTEITKMLGLRQPTVSYHLKQMQEQGLLAKRKEGRKVYFFVEMACPENGACFGQEQ
jgi:ArsR family transcriptional regulator